jgi:L-fuculose-phosphate aldolase
VSEAGRRALIDAARRLERDGLLRGTAGNLSVRCDDGMLITPSGLPYGELEPADVVRVGDDGAAEGRRAPSSEWRFHRAVYRAEPGAGAVIHAHSTFATALACLRRGIPSFHYEVALAGGPNIRCAAYATFGTDELADHMLEALRGRRACLLANHGLVAWGGTLRAAAALALKVEHLAEIYVRCLQLGEPELLDADEMARVLARTRGYGETS